MKKTFCIVLCAIIALSLAACGSSGSSATPAPTEAPKEPPVLTGDWEQSNKNSEDSYQIATITDTTVEVFWKTPDMQALYWSGTFEPPTAAGDYSWESVRDKEKTDLAIMAATADTKTFTYSNGELSFDVQAMGVTTTVRMAKK